MAEDEIKQQSDQVSEKERAPEKESERTSREAVGSFDELVKMKQQAMAEQKDPARLEDPSRAKFASMKFGRPEIVDEQGSVLVKGMDARTRGMAARDSLVQEDPGKTARAQAPTGDSRGTTTGEPAKTGSEGAQALETPAAQQSEPGEPSVQITPDDVGKQFEEFLKNMAPDQAPADALTDFAEEIRKASEASEGEAWTPADRGDAIRVAREPTDKAGQVTDRDSRVPDVSQAIKQIADWMGKQDRPPEVAEAWDDFIKSLPPETRQAFEQAAKEPGPQAPNFVQFASGDLAKESTGQLKDASETEASKYRFYEKLNPEDKENLRKIAEKHPEKAKEIFQQFDRIYSSDRLSEEKRLELVREMVRNIANPGNIRQIGEATCAIANAERELAYRHPEKYAETVANWVTKGRHGGVPLPGKLEDYDRYGEGSLASKVFQVGSANYVASLRGGGRFDPEKQWWIGGNRQADDRGVDSQEQAKLIDRFLLGNWGIIPDYKQKTPEAGSPEQFGKVIEDLAGKDGKGYPVNIQVRVRGEDGQYYNHQVRIVGVERDATGKITGVKYEDPDPGKQSPRTEPIDQFYGRAVINSKDGKSVKPYVNVVART